MKKYCGYCGNKLASTLEVLSTYRDKILSLYDSYWESFLEECEEDNESPTVENFLSSWKDYNAEQDIRSYLTKRFNYSSEQNFEIGASDTLVTYAKSRHFNVDNRATWTYFSVTDTPNMFLKRYITLKNITELEIPLQNSWKNLIDSCAEKGYNLKIINSSKDMERTDDHIIIYFSDISQKKDVDAIAQDFERKSNALDRGTISRSNFGKDSLYKSDTDFVISAFGEELIAKRDETRTESEKDLAERFNRISLYSKHRSKTPGTRPGVFPLILLK